MAARGREEHKKNIADDRDRGKPRHQDFRNGHRWSGGPVTGITEPAAPASARPLTPGSTVSPRRWLRRPCATGCRRPGRRGRGRRCQDPAHGLVDAAVGGRLVHHPADQRRSPGVSPLPAECPLATLGGFDGAEFEHPVRRPSSVEAERSTGRSAITPAPPFPGAKGARSPANPRSLSPWSPDRRSSSFLPARRRCRKRCRPGHGRPQGEPSAGQLKVNFFKRRLRQN